LARRFGNWLYTRRPARQALTTESWYPITKDPASHQGECLRPVAGCFLWSPLASSTPTNERTKLVLVMEGSGHLAPGGRLILGLHFQRELRAQTAPATFNLVVCGSPKRRSLSGLALFSCEQYVSKKIIQSSTTRSIKISPNQCFVALSAGRHVIIAHTRKYQGLPYRTLRATALAYLCNQKECQFRILIAVRI
jgi:hypothetical protein